MAKQHLSRRKKIVFGLAAAACGGVLLLLVAELTIRYFDWVRQDNEELKVYTEAPTASGSFRLKPNFVGATQVEGQEVRIRTNSHGMHWFETSYEKPPGKQRIAFVGDSFTFGMWAGSFEEAFVGVFSALLPEEEYEVLNFGVPGYAFDDIELIVKEEVIRYDPDYVVLAMFNGNDIPSTYMGLDKYEVKDGVAVLNEDVIKEKIPPKYRHPEPKEPSAPAPLGIRVRRFLRNNVATYKRLSELKHRLLTKEEAQAEQQKSLFLDSLQVGEQFRTYPFWSQKDYPEVAVKAKEASLRHIAQINAFLEERGVELAIVAIPYREQVYVRHPEGEDYDVRYPQEHVGAYARAHDIPYLDLLPAMREYVWETEEKIYYRTDTHINNKGHRLVGRLIYNWFLEEVVPRDTATCCHGMEEGGVESAEQAVI